MQVCSKLHGQFVNDTYQTVKLNGQFEVRLAMHPASQKAAMGTSITVWNFVTYLPGHQHVLKRTKNTAQTNLFGSIGYNTNRDIPWHAIYVNINQQFCLPVINRVQLKTK